jgi:hypothetical protein
LWEVVIGYKGESMIIDAKGMGAADGGGIGAGPRESSMASGQSIGGDMASPGAADDEIPF